MTLQWEDDRAEAPDGTIYALCSATVRYEGTTWWVQVYEDPSEPPTRELDPGPDVWPTKRRARRVAEIDAEEHRG